MALLTTGDPAPWFIAPSSGNPNYNFHSAAGRYLVLCFFGSAGLNPVSIMLKKIMDAQNVFQDQHASFFGVSFDPEDLKQKRAKEKIPGVRFFWDFEQKIGKLYKVISDINSDRKNKKVFSPVSFILDTNLRILAVLPIKNPENHADELIHYVKTLPPLTATGLVTPGAPILIVPRLFEKSFCQELIKLYDLKGGTESGFMRNDSSGKTVLVVDHNHKRRSDYSIEEEEIQRQIKLRIERRLVPEILKAFQFHVTRIERYIVARYSAGEGGYFKPHRDNTTKGTAHRRFAVTINLNAEDYEGGDLKFPEYDQRTYRAPTGGAVVFSCSLLHEATPVVKGNRYCCLPFLYDEGGAKIREQNLDFLGDDKLRDQLKQSLGVAKPK
ncbi:MAG: 2OG-Fe(II) oxygenase [Alphaproteobacteria bacterium]|nr:2OG-Fe(II) oxygenase [Alphaproteobacteria bacterium]